MICPTCGTKNPDGVPQCDTCGQGLEAWAPTHVGPLPGVPASNVPTVVGPLPAGKNSISTSKGPVPNEAFGAEPTATSPGVIGGALNATSGTTIAGRYEIKSVLGRGGVGVVYRAMDLDLGEEIAIKVLQPQSHRDPAEVDRFKREIITARRITHPNVIRIHDFGMAGNEAFISMQLLPGGTLAQRIENGALPIAEAVEIAIGICDGLSAAHQEGIVHRDIKPDNVLFDAAGRPKLVDFGLARLANATTRTIGFSGTPFYMSPEQADGADVTVRSDVYSLGVLLFEMFTGRLPFIADSLVRLAVLHTKERPPQPRALRLDLPPALEQIILRSLEKSPGRRYQTAGEIGNALRDWQENPGAAVRAPAVTPNPLAGGQRPRARPVPALTTLPAGKSQDPTLIRALPDFMVDVPTEIPSDMRPTERPTDRATGPLSGAGFPVRAMFAGVGAVGVVALGIFVAMKFGGAGQTTEVRPTPMVSATPTSLAVGTKTPLAAASKTVEATSTPAATQMAAATPTAANTRAVTATPKPSATATPRATATKTAKPTATPTPTGTPTMIAVATPVQMARVKFLAIPFAEVFMDGRSMGKTPLSNEFKVSAGSHNFKFVSGKGDIYSEKVVLQPGEQATISLNWKVEERRFDIRRN